MEKVLEILGITSISTFTAYSLIRYLSKNFFENYLVKRLESHKSELARLNISHQIQFSSLHKERAEVIKKIYDSLYDYKIAIMDFFEAPLDKNNPERHLKDKLSIWSKAVVEFSSTFHRNKIFFSAEQVELISTLNNEMNKINEGTRDFLKSFKKAEEQIDAINSKSEKFADLKKESDVLLDQSMKLEEQLETEFRKLLGVEL